MTVNIEQLSAYYDGELALEERRTVEAHVSGCSDCQSALRHWLQASHALVATASSPSRPRRLPAVVVAAVAAFLLLGSGVAVASGALNEVVRIAQEAFGAPSRPVTLETARVANLPLPRTTGLPGGWTVNQVQLTVTPTWRSVDLQYRRPGSRGLGVTAWSQDIIVNPTAERLEVVTVSGVPVELGYGRGDSATARFVHDESTVVIRFFADEVGRDEVRTLVATWIERARR